MSRVYAVVQAARALWGRVGGGLMAANLAPLIVPKRNFTEKKLKRMIKETDGKIDHYLKQLDQHDKQEAGQKGCESRTAQGEDRTVQSSVARSMKQFKRDLERQRREPNIIDLILSRLCVSSTGWSTAITCRSWWIDKHKLIVEHEVTNEVTDPGATVGNGVEKAQEMLGVTMVEVVADRGYYNGEASNPSSWE